MEDLLSKVSTIFSDLHQQALSSSLLPPAEVPVGSLFGDFLAPIPPINLLHPQPDALIVALTDVGATFDAAQELSEIHARSCSQLAQEYEEVYENICFQISMSGDNASAEEQSRAFTRLQKIRRFYDRTVASWAAELVQSVATRGSQSQTQLTKPSKKRPFNADYLSKLEAFFQLNPKPSHADKVFLAKQSRMTVKQINVWFQNHRARCKKDTTATRPIVLERLSPLITGTQPQALGQGADADVSDVETVHEEESNDPSIRCCSRSSSITLVDEDIYGTVFKTKNPDYAFPTKYPPELQEEPFPCVIGDFTFPKPVWRRECTTLPHASESRLHTMTDLVKAMERLSLKSTEESPSTPSTESVRAPQVSLAKRSEEYSCHLTPFIIRPPLAPLPSLIRSYTQSTKRKSSICAPSDARFILEQGAGCGLSTSSQSISRLAASMSKPSKASTKHGAIEHISAIPSAEFRPVSPQRTIPQSTGASEFKTYSPLLLPLRDKDSLHGQSAVAEQSWPLSIPTSSSPSAEVFSPHSSVYDVPAPSLSIEGEWWDFQTLLPSYMDFTAAFPSFSHIC